MARTRIVHRRLAPPLLTLALLATALIAPASGQASAFTGSQTVSEFNGAAYTAAPPAPAIGADSAGNAFMAIRAGKGNGAASPQTIQISTRPAGSSFASPMTEVATTTATFQGPALAVDAAGHALIVYADTGTPNVLHVVSFTASGATHVETVFTNPTGAILSPSVALDPSGNGAATVAWYTTPTAGAYLPQSIQGTVGGSWPAVATSIGNQTTSIISNPHVAIDKTGRAVVTWIQSVTGIDDVEFSVRSGGTFSIPASVAHSVTSPFSMLSEKTNHQGGI